MKDYLNNIKKTAGNKNLKSAIFQVEKYIVDINPKNYQDIRIATKNISRAALGAYLSVHSVSETIEFINQIAHSMIDDVSEHIETNGNHSKTLH